jgi:P27 family predicted phage terminase small subunit
MPTPVPIARDDPHPPKHLGRPGKALWRTICSDFALENHHLPVLQVACESLDRATQARELVEAEGLTYTDSKGGIHPHPGVAIERDSRTLLLRALRELSLDSDAVEQYSRPSRIANRYSGGV